MKVHITWPPGNPTLATTYNVVNVTVPEAIAYFDPFCWPMYVNHHDKMRRELAFKSVRMK